MAEPSPPIRELIFTNVATALTTIAGDGRVTRGALSPLESFAFPLLCLLPVDDNALVHPRSYQEELTIIVRAWVDEEAIDAPSGLEAVLADIHEALMVDTSRGGSAQTTLRQQTTYIYSVSTERLAGADVAYMIHYKTSIHSPRDLG